MQTVSVSDDSGSGIALPASGRKKSLIIKDRLKGNITKRPKLEHTYVNGPKFSTHRENVEAFEDEYKPLQYMKKQKDINPRMRAILVDWLVEVHHSLNLQPPALWLCVNFLDRYLEINQVPRSKLQLVGITALKIASTFDCMHTAMEVDFCVHITAHAFERSDVTEMERRIYQVLNFHIPKTGHTYLTRYLDIINATETIRLLTCYYTERNLQEYDSLLHSPRKFVSAAIYASILQQTTEVMRNNPSIKYTPRDVWPQSLVEETGYSEADMISVARVIVQHVGEEPVTVSKRVLNATRKKYDTDKYQRVSRLNLPDFSLV
mmetsp:Transcript_21435/g.21552  ORF Transcript_21435/g.21552 Transcript_21435/m.21552 type:complete len:320 (+) Transcript_21435:133-1092(+)